MKNRKIKIVRTGWVAKDMSIDELLDRADDGDWERWDLGLIFTRKDSERLWDADDWPPRKVRITIEEIKP